MRNSLDVLIACEFSGIVREAFARRGHRAVSCDFLPTELPTSSNSCHYEGDVRSMLKFRKWDLMIAHPPCTYLCGSGARWWAGRVREQEESVRFFLLLAECHIPRIAVENPVGIMSRIYRKPDQIIQPYQFGHLEIKTTCLWLKNLPKLVPTKYALGDRKQVCWKASPGIDRWKVRARTYNGITEAMGSQWGDIAK